MGIGYAKTKHDDDPKRAAPEFGERVPGRKRISQNELDLFEIDESGNLYFNNRRVVLEPN